MIAINGYFRSQPITGQQRYATEVADRLLALDRAIVEIKPPRWASNRYTQWSALQMVPRLNPRASTLVSLTARTSAFGRNQLVTIHDLFPITNPEWFAPAYARLHARLLRHHLRTAAGVAVVSEPIAAEVRALARPGMPVVLAPNAPAAMFASGVRPAERPSRLPARYFLTVGSLEPRKNLGRLIRAYGRLPASVRTDYPLLMVGGSAAAFQSLPDLDTGLPDGVQLLGRVPDSELVELYAHASALVSVSLAEGFGIPLVEYASVASGCLVLSDIPSYRWVAADADPVWVAPTSVESITDGLLRATLQKTGPEAIRRVATRFTWDDSARRIHELATALDRD